MSIFEPIAAQPYLTNRRALLAHLTTLGTAVALSTLSGCNVARQEQNPPTLKLAASIYVGWMPWMFAAQSNLLQQTGRKHGVKLDLIRADYAETINQFISGHADAVLITNIDALGAFAEAKIACDVVLIGSYSAGNDAVLVPAGKSEIADGSEVILVRNSVSEYVLARYLEQTQRSLSALKLTDVSDAAIARTFVAAGDALAGAVTWKPIVDGMESKAGAKRIFDSAALPGEIADTLVLRRSALEANPHFATALLETWFGVMESMAGAKRQNTIDALASLSGSSAEDYLNQLATTQLMDTPAKALAALSDPKLASVMERVSAFVADRGLAKTDRASWYSIGTQSNGTLRFNPAPLQKLLA
jgi:NitT/TauT family transport system substrate-binding protein